MFVCRQRLNIRPGARITGTGLTNLPGTIFSQLNLPRDTEGIRKFPVTPCQSLFLKLSRE